MPCLPGRRAAPIIALLGSLAAGACAPDLAYRDRAMAMQGAQLVPPDTSMARLPPELDKTKLVVRRELAAGVLREDVLFSNNTVTQHPNRLTVRTRAGETGWPVGGSSLAAFNKESIDLTMQREFPNALAIGAAQEGAGPGGRYAYQSVRNSDGANCIYAWQLVDGRDWLAAPAQPHALDFRYCDAKLTTDQLKDLFSQITLAGAWTLYPG